MKAVNRLETGAKCSRACPNWHEQFSWTKNTWQVSAEGSGICGFEAVPSVSGSLRNSDYAITFAASVVGSGSCHGKSNRILHTKRVPEKERELDGA